MIIITEEQFDCLVKRFGEELTFDLSICHDRYSEFDLPAIEDFYQNIQFVCAILNIKSSDLLVTNESDHEDTIKRVNLKYQPKVKGNQCLFQNELHTIIDYHTDTGCFIIAKKDSLDQEFSVSYHMIQYAPLFTV